MTIYIINGFTREIGLWEVEVFSSEKEAVDMFNYYVDEYKADISEDDEWFATCPDGFGRFSLDVRNIE